VETSKPKPDLLAGAAHMRRPAQDKRILAHLEHGARAPARVVTATGWTIDGWTIGLFALLLVMCSAAWLMHDRTITQDTFRQSESRSVRPRAAARTAPAVPHVTDEAPQAAAIVNVDTSTVPAPDAESPTAATVAIANAAGTTRPVASQTPPARTAVAAARTAIRSPSTLPGRATTPVSADTDVTLLTALVAHAGTPTTVTPERSRDVVERQDGDTTAQLLARCKQLGMIEGMLCRSRICSGRWENDAACRVPSH
jgi:hypothetical protein